MHFNTVQTLRTELIKTKTKLSEAQGSAELLAATKDFCKDGKACSGTFFFTSSQNNDNVLFFFTDLNHVATQTDSPSAENEDMLNSTKDFCKDGKTANF